MKRFYTNVTPQQTDLGWNVTLDGRPIKSQGGEPQIVPTEALARMLAAEWAGQGETIDAAGFAARDMADYAIDIVAHDRQETIDKLLGFAETDTLCYRADPDEPLFRRQQEVWEPLLADFEGRQGVLLSRVSGVMHRPQPPETLAKLRARLEAMDPFTLAALEQLTSLGASLTIGLSALEGDADPLALWNAANLEEEWQAEQWGSDEEAIARLEKRKGDFLKALQFANAARG